MGKNYKLNTKFGKKKKKKIAYYELWILQNI